MYQALSSIFKYLNKKNSHGLKFLDKFAKKKNNNNEIKSSVNIFAFTVSPFFFTFIIFKRHLIFDGIKYT